MHPRPKPLTSLWTYIQIEVGFFTEIKTSDPVSHNNPPAASTLNLSFSSLQGATRTLAKQLVALRSQKERLMTARARITGVGYAASSAATQASLAGVMGNVTGVMQQVNNAVSTEETAKIMQQFALQNEKMAMSEDMMNDALIDAVRLVGIAVGLVSFHFGGGVCLFF